MVGEDRPRHHSRHLGKIGQRQSTKSHIRRGHASCSDELADIRSTIKNVHDMGELIARVDQILAQPINRVEILGRHPEIVTPVSISSLGENSNCLIC
jgi:hypothetical protein